MNVWTSESHPIRVDWLPPDAAGGRVGMTLAPGKHSVSKYSVRAWKRDLGADLDRLRSHWGVTDLVCLLEANDLKRLEISSLIEEATSRGITPHWEPMPDAGVPPDVARTRQLVDDLVRRVDEGAVVAIHCEGGLGRTGIVAGCYLIARGVAPEAALSMLASARHSDKCPETERQRDFIRNFARR